MIVVATHSRALARGLVRQLDPDALVDPALGLVSRHPDPADLAGIRDVRAAVRLEVEADDLDRPDLLDARWEEVHLGPDEVRDRERLLTRQDVRGPRVARVPTAKVDRDGLKYWSLRTFG